MTIKQVIIQVSQKAISRFYRISLKSFMVKVLYIHYRSPIPNKRPALITPAIKSKKKK